MLNSVACELTQIKWAEWYVSYSKLALIACYLPRQGVSYENIQNQFH